jgi:hypothetical protein
LLEVEIRSLAIHDKVLNQAHNGVHPFFVRIAASFELRLNGKIMRELALFNVDIGVQNYQVKQLLLDQVRNNLFSGGDALN